MQGGRALSLSRVLIVDPDEPRGAMRGRFALGHGGRRSALWSFSADVLSCEDGAGLRWGPVDGRAECSAIHRRAAGPIFTGSACRRLLLVYALCSEYRRRLTDTLYEGGLLRATLSFPQDFPLNSLKMKFLAEMWHTNGLSFARACPGAGPGADYWDFVARSVQE